LRYTRGMRAPPVLAIVVAVTGACASAMHDAADEPWYNQCATSDLYDELDADDEAAPPPAFALPPACDGALALETHARDDAHSDEARALFEDGQRAYEIGRYDDALETFCRLHHHTPLVPTLWNIAAALERLGAYGHAAEFLEAYAARAGDAANSEVAAERAEALRERHRARR
jgi:tetratricopeptide (TPR) repeat protein